MAATRDFSVFTATVALGALPTEVVQRTRLLVLDLVGNIVRARHDAECAPALFAASRMLGLACGNSGVFGDASRYTPAGAAFLNAALAAQGASKVAAAGAPVLGAALAAGEMASATGADVLAAIAAGYDVTTRALASYAHTNHPHLGHGAVGAAAAAARAFGLNAEQAEAALALALQGAAWAPAMWAGLWAESLRAGWAAMTGLTAATLAREGYEAPPISGLLPDEAAAGLGQTFELSAAEGMAEHEVRARFDGQAAGKLGADRALRLANAVLSLDRAKDVSGLALLSSPLMAAKLAS